MFSFARMKQLLATIRLILVFTGSLVLVIVGLTLLLICLGSPVISRFITKNWARFCLLTLNVKVNFSGQIPSQRVILMANHRSYIDIFLAFSRYPASIVAKKELGRWPIIGWSVRLARMILVDRSRKSSLIATMRAIQAEIDKGGSVILFPEGGIVEGRLTGPFKHGSFKIAQQTGTPVVPAAIHYHDDGVFWGDESFLTNFYRQMGKWRTTVDFWIGEPITAPTDAELMTAVKDAIDLKLKEFSS